MFSNSAKELPYNNLVLAASYRHCPVGLLIDQSGSMAENQSIAGKAINAFITKLKQRDATGGAIDLGISVYNHQYEQLCPFRSLKYAPENISPCAAGGTRADIAIPQFLREVQSFRHDVLRDNCVSYGRAFIFHITDGFSDGDMGIVARTVSKLESSKSIRFFTIAVPGANIPQISIYTDKSRILNLTNQSDFESSLESIMKSLAILSASSANVNSGSLAWQNSHLCEVEDRQAAEYLAAFSLQD